MEKLTTLATEQSTYIITVAFTDEDGASVVPKTVVWTLTDTSGTVINSRTQVSATPGASVDIVLSGDDLAITGETGKERNVVVEATYDSSRGNDLPLTDGVRFTISPLPYVS